jgi:IS30 family transposase
MLATVRGKDTVQVVDTITKKINRLPSELKSTLAWDRGMSVHGQ